MSTISRPVFIHAHRQTPWRTQLQLIGIFSLVVVLIGMIAGVYLNVTARAATIGREIQGMQEVVFDGRRAIADLETELAALTSITVMQERAKDMGFQNLDTEEILYILVSGYSGKQEVVLAPPSVPSVASTPALPPEYTQTLYDWLKEFVSEKTNPGSIGRTP